MNKSGQLPKLFILVFCLAVIGPTTAFAHRPHDVVTAIALSSDYETDHTLYILVRGDLFRSTDGGGNWKRLVKGIDNRYFLTSLRASPADARTLLVATAGDGIYKSEDAGDSWSRINEGLEDLDVSLIAMSKHSPDRALAAPSAGGLYITADAGKRWNRTAGIRAKITALAYVADDKNAVFAGDSEGAIYVSRNGGKEWEKISAIDNCGAVSVIEASPSFSKDKTVFAGTQRAGVFKSVDAGSSFVKADNGLTDMQIQGMALSPSFGSNSTLYVSTASRGAYYSKDAASSWEPLGNGLTKDSQADEMKMPHFYELTISQKKDGTLFLGGFNGLFKSTDGGVHWKKKETLSPGTITAFDISPDYAKDSTVVVATYVGEGVWLSRDKGKSWKSINISGDFSKAKQDPRRFFDIAFSPDYARDRTLFATLLYDKFLITHNRGSRWHPVALPETARGSIIMVSPDFARDKTVFLFSQYGSFFRSTDGGNTFSILSRPGRVGGNNPPVGVISPDFKDDKTIYISNEAGVSRSTDGGVTWESVSNGISAPADSLLAISPDYQHDGTLFACNADGLYKTYDEGKRWEKLPCAGIIEALAVSPGYARDRTLCASVRGRGLFLSIDGGKSFAPIGDDSISFSSFACPHSTRMIRFSPAYASDRTIFGTGSAKREIYRSTDGGLSWKALPFPRLNKSSFNIRALAGLLVRRYAKPALAAILFMAGLYVLHRIRKR